MIVFALLAGAMLLAALALVAWPLLRPARAGRADRTAAPDMNVAIHRGRLAELVAEHERGALDDEALAAMRGDLERELLRDAPAGAAPRPAPGGSRRVAGAAAALFAALAIGTYLGLGDTRFLGATPSRAARDSGQHPVQEMVQRLRARLRAQPADAEGWILLGRSYSTLERYRESAEAFAAAHRLLGDDAPLLADYAEALASANGNQLAGEPARLARRALERQPNHPKALWLVGWVAMQAGDGSAAAGYWRRLVAQLPPASPAADTLRAHIAQAEAIGGTPGAAAVAGPAARLTVRVSLDPVVVARAAPGDSVFIYARAAEGPRAPLAVMRKQVRDLPATVTLDDSMSMAPGLTLSKFPLVVAGARVSRSGEASARPGDLEGLSEAVRWSARPSVEVRIGRVVP